MVPLVAIVVVVVVVVETFHMAVVVVVIVMVMVSICILILDPEQLFKAMSNRAQNLHLFELLLSYRLLP